VKAVVMAGGAGSRLRPLTINRPKPMVPIVNKPVMGHIFDLLKRHGITDVVVTLQYMAEDVQDYFGNGHSFGMNIEYSIEKVPLGTAGSVKLAQGLLDDTFVVISGDALTDINLSEVIAFHEDRKSVATLTLYRVANPLEYGVIITDESGRIQQFQEKPSWGEVISDTVNTGIYVLEPEVLDHFEGDIKFDFSQDLFPILLERGDPMYGYVADGYWCDVGNIAEYMRATGDVLTGKVHVEPIGHRLKSGAGVWGEDALEIAPDAQLYGPIFLGRGVKIMDQVIIHGPTVIRDYSLIDRHAHIERSIIWRNCYIGEGVELRGAIIGRQCSLKHKVVVFEGAVVGDSSIIGEDAVIHPGVKIWPEKEVEDGATVRSSIIWGAQGRRVLFGRYGVTGLVNVDLTPEFAAKLGAAFAATLPKGATVTINRDPNRSPRMLKRALISGVPSAGVNVLDVRSLPIPVARFFTRSISAQGGVHVRLSPYDSRLVDIKFFDGRGQDLGQNSERNIERVFFREDFRRVFQDEIGTISYANDVIEHYTSEFLSVLQAAAITRRDLYIAVDFANAPTAQVLAPILARLNCRVVALNEAVDETKMAIPQEEHQKALTTLTSICSALETDLGVRIDVGGERVYVVDDRGRLVPPTKLAAAIARAALQMTKGGVIAVPATAPSVFERIAEEYGGRVLRTRYTHYALMQAAATEDVVLATDANGAYLWPQWQPVVDGMMTVGKLLEFLAMLNVHLSELVDAVPSYHMAQGTVDCPWESKGTVMRLLNEQLKARLAPQIDGVRVVLSDDQWVLVLPDPDRPLFHIYAQAGTDEAAGQLVTKYARIVEVLQD